MNSRSINTTAVTVHVLAFDTGDEAADGWLKLVKEKHLTAARFTAIGAFQEVTLGWFDLEKKEYRENEVGEQVEVLSLVGNVAEYDGKPKAHAHVVVGQKDGTAHGGHLLRGVVPPTLEVSLVETPVSFKRVMDEATGLP